MSTAPNKTPPKAVDAVLDYLQHHMPAYPFNNKLDADFVRELGEDFEDVDILEETKGFRWFYADQPIQARTARLSLRRWIANARNRRFKGNKT